MRMSNGILASAIAAGLMCPAALLCQDHRKSDRPSIGVALSGGAALGLAHIGVLRYFEEQHIPIDKIGGTSMGGLVGGLYAAGMDSVQIETLVRHADWDALLNPNPPFSNQPIVDKQKWNRTFGSLTLRFGRRFALPSGLNPGESLSLLLSRSTLGYAEVFDFDQLPTPFRCVATDLVSGDSVVLSKGSLPVAMRATMALPGIFTPVRIENMVLVDGGVLQNIPVAPVREMGADDVIAVALETDRPHPSQIKSLSDVMRQTISIALAKNEQLSESKADLVIRVDTRRFSATDYRRAEEIIQAGYDAAKAQQSQLARFEISPAQWSEYIAERKARMRPSGSRGRILAVASPDPSFQKNAESELRRALGNETVSEQRLEKVLSGMVAATAVPGASYEWEQDDNPDGGYRVKFAQRPTEQVLARVSAQYSVSAGEPSRFGLRLSNVFVPEHAYKTRILTAMNIGYDPSIQGELYKPFGGTQYFVAPQFYGGRTHFNSYAGTVRQSDTRDRVFGALYGGVGTWRYAQFSLGGEGGYDSYSREVTVDGVRSQSGAFGKPQVRWIFNHQDDGGLPSRGTRLEGSAGYLFKQDGSFPVLQYDYSSFTPLNRHITIFALGDMGTSLGRKMGYFDQFTAGDPSNLPAFRYQEFHANTLITAGSGVTLHPHAIPHLSSHPDLALWYQAGRFDLGSQGWATHQSASITALFPTQLGASGFELSFDENGKARFRLMLGSF